MKRGRRKKEGQEKEEAVEKVKMKEKGKVEEGEDGRVKTEKMSTCKI